MPKLVNSNNQELFQDVILWSGSVDSGTITLNDSYKKFKRLVFMLSNGIQTTLEVINGITFYYLVAGDTLSNKHETITLSVTFTSDTQISFSMIGATHENNVHYYLTRNINHVIGRY